MNVHPRLGRRIARLVLFIGGASSSAGCYRPTADFVMRTASDEARLDARAPQDRARVVFMRERLQTHDRFSRDPMVVRIADGRGRLLGDLVPHSWFATLLEPGKHEIYLWTDEYSSAVPQVSAIAADLAPGKTYFVDIGRAFPVQPGVRQMALVPTSVPLEGPRGMTALEVDPHFQRGAEESFRGRIELRVDQGHANVLEGRCAHLRPEDGYVLGEAVD